MSQSLSRLLWAFGLSTFVSLISITAAGQSRTAILTLKNGDRLSGDIVSEETNRVTITNAVLGKIAVAREAIERMETKVAPAPSPPPAATATNQLVIRLTGPQEKRLSELLELYRSGRITPDEYHSQRAKLVAAAETVPATNIVAMKPDAASAAGTAQLSSTAPSSPVKPKGPKRWSGDIQLGVDFALSERNRDLFTGRLKLNYAYKHFRNAADYLFAYGHTDGVLSANRMDGSMKTDYDLLKRFYVYNLGGAGYDEIRRIDLRFEEGPGGGWFIIRGTNHVLRGEYGINYQVQMNADGDENKRFYHRYAEDFSWKPNARLSFDEKLEFFPIWGDWSQYRIRFEANIRYWIGSKISLVVTLLDQYDTDPPSGVGQNDLQVRSSVGVKF